MGHSERHRDGRRNPRARVGLHVCAAKLSVLAACTMAHGGIVDMNGGTSWSGWTSVGDSRTPGIWARGSTPRAYNIYSTLFTLDASQTVGGSRVADGAVGDGISYTGDTESSLFSGSWQVGDRVLGVGLQYTDWSQLRLIAIAVDWEGDSLRAASDVGVLDREYGANTGDLSVYTPESEGVERFRGGYYSIMNGVFGQGGTSETPYGTTATVASPARSFAVLANGSALAALSAQYFINLDAIARSNGGLGFGEGVLGPSTKIGITEAESSFLFTQQVFSVPTPGAVALLGLAMLIPVRRRRRRD